MKFQRLVFACLVAPLVVMPVATTVSLLLAIFGGDPGAFFVLLRQSSEAGLSTLASTYEAMVVLGVPTLLLLHSRGSLGRRSLEVAGLIWGGILFLTQLLPHPIWVPVGMVTGFLVGHLVWRLALEALPDEEEDAVPVHRHLPATAPRETIDSDLGVPQAGDAALTVLYDVRCALCCRARVWLAAQPKYVPMAFVAAGSNEAKRRFPGLDHDASLEELTVVGWGGEVYRGAKAWVMCLWALKRYRSAALRMSEPEMLPVARRLIAWVSRNRFQIGEAAGWTK